MQVGNANFVGRFVVDAEAASSSSARLDGVASRHGARQRAPRPTEPERNVPSPDGTASTRPDRPAPDPAAAAIVGGALADYDTLAPPRWSAGSRASVPRSSTPSGATRRSTRNRRTILNRASQLLEEAAERPQPAGSGAMELARLAEAGRPAGLHPPAPWPSWRAGRCGADRRSWARHHRDPAGTLAGRRRASCSWGSTRGPWWACSAVTPDRPGAATGRQRPDRVLLRGAGRPGRGRRQRTDGGCRGLVAEQGCADVDALALPGDRTTKQRLEAAGLHGPAADAQPPVGLKRRSALTRRGGGGGIARPSSLARAGTDAGGVAGRLLGHLVVGDARPA